MRNQCKSMYCSHSQISLEVLLIAVVFDVQSITNIYCQSIAHSCLCSTFCYHLTQCWSVHPFVDHMIRSILYFQFEPTLIIFQLLYNISQCLHQYLTVNISTYVVETITIACVTLPKIQVSLLLRCNLEDGADQVLMLEMSFAMPS